jgi:hypothetical protein
VDAVALGLSRRLSDMEGELGDLERIAAASWSGPAAEQFQAELSERRRALSRVCGDLATAARRPA